jgi:UDP-N-acetylglucosamine--dolichyl-phosphate N-acetylglucosaminephosphotransferase
MSGLILTRLLIKKATQKEYVIPDMYKPDRPLVPTMGGLAIMGASLVALVAAQFVTHDKAHLLLFYFVAFVFGLYGLADDLFGFKMRYDKVLILFVLALPAATLATDTDLDLVFTNLQIGQLYPYLIVPFYIMVIANLINVHAGFNALDVGLTAILFIFAAVRAYMMNNGESLLLLAPIVPALVAFLWFNKYPARVFPGNVGTYYLGGALGTYLILNNMELFGFVIFIPHVVNFIIDLWTLKIRRVPLAKFGGIRPDGTIAPPPTMKFVSLKFLVTSILPLRETEAVLVLYGITILFGILGVVLVP